jgi:hypothetical protein
VNAHAFRDIIPHIEQLLLLAPWPVSARLLDSEVKSESLLMLPVFYCKLGNQRLAPRWGDASPLAATPENVVRFRRYSLFVRSQVILASVLIESVWLIEEVS